MSYLEKNTNPHHTKTLSEKAKLALKEFEDAVRQDEMKGAQEPCVRKEIESRLRTKRNKLIRMLPWVDKVKAPKTLRQLSEAETKS